MGKSKKDKHRKEKKNKHEDRDASHDRRLSPSPTRTRHKSRRQHSASPPAHKRPRAAARSPSPPIYTQTSRDRRNKKRAEARDSEEAPARELAAAPAILGRIRFTGRGTDAEPSAAAANTREESLDLRVRSRDQRKLKSERQDAVEREPRARQPRVSQATAAYVPEEQFWQQRRGAKSPPRRDDRAYERSHRAPASKEADGELERGKSSVLARLTFLGASGSQQQQQPASPSREGKRRRQKSPEGRPDGLSSGREAHVSTRARAGDRVTRVKVADRVSDVLQNLQQTSGAFAPGSESKARSKLRPLPSKGRDLRSGTYNDSADSDQLDRVREREASEGPDSVQHYQQSLSPQPREQYGGSERPQHDSSAADAPPAGQRQSSRKRHRQEREGHVEDGRHESPAPRSTSRGKSKGRVHDDEGGSRGQDRGKFDMHGEEEEVVEVRRSSRSRTRPAPAPEKEKESRSKEKSKRKHKESKREREAGDAQPAGRAHERRGGGGGDVWEDGEMLHNADAQQNTGPQRRSGGDPRKVETSEGRAQTDASEGGGMLQQSARPGGSPLPPPPEELPEPPKPTPWATFSPARDLILGPHASREHADRGRSPAMRGSGQGVVGGMRGRSERAPQPPGSLLGGGGGMHWSPDRRRKHAAADYGLQSGSGREHFRSDHVASPSRQQQLPHGRGLVSHGSRRQPQWSAPMERYEPADTGTSDRGGWVRPTHRWKREQEDRAGFGDGVDGGDGMHDDIMGHAGSRGDGSLQEASEAEDRQARARFPLPMVLSGRSAVGGAAPSRTMQAVADMWRSVLARDLNVPAAEGSVVGAAVRDVLGQGGPDGDLAGGGAVGGQGGWAMYQGALRRPIDPAAWLEAQPKLRARGAEEDGADAWRRKVQACTSVVFQCSELLRVMKRKGHAAAPGS